MDVPPELAAFIEREHPRLVRAVDLLLDDRAVAEEVAQETLLRAASRWEHVGELSSPGGWAHRVAVNLATSQLRRRRVAWRARSRVASAESQPEPDTATALAVRAALSRLDEPQRRLLVLRHVLGWSAREIGDLDGVRADTVRQQLHRAREALRVELGPELDIEVDDEEHNHVHGAR